MLDEEQGSIQLLNTAIIKSKEKKIDYSYEERLSRICQSSSIKSLTMAITHLAENEKISRDQAAVRIVETIRELDNLWNDYVMIEGMSKLKSILNTTPSRPN